MAASWMPGLGAVAARTAWAASATPARFAVRLASAGHLARRPLSVLPRPAARPAAPAAGAWRLPARRFNSTNAAEGAASPPPPPPPPPPPSGARRALQSVAAPLKKASDWYMHYLHEYPIATKSVTSGFMYCFGDLLAQAVAPQGSDKLDTARAATFFVYGLFVAGPIYHYWFSRLDRLPYLMMKTRRFRQQIRFRRLQRNARELGITLPPELKPKKVPELSKWTKVSSKVLADQFIFSPAYLGVFFYTTGLMRGQSWDECTAHLKEVFWPSLLADCAVWPAAQVINFAFVPVPLQPIYVNVLNVFWNAFLSFMAHKTH